MLAFCNYLVALSNFEGLGGHASGSCRVLVYRSQSLFDVGLVLFACGKRLLLLQAHLLAKRFRCKFRKTTIVLSSSVLTTEVGTTSGENKHTRVGDVRFVRGDKRERLMLLGCFV